MKTIESISDRASLAYSSDGKLFLNGSDEKSLKLWDLLSGSLIKTFEGHIDVVLSVAFSPDGKLILSGSRDNSVKLWDVSSGTTIKTLEGHNEGVISVAFSFDGKFILSGSEDKSIKLWDPSSGKLLHSFDSLDSIPINFSRLFKSFSCSCNNVFCKFILSPYETSLSCKNMILIDPIELSLINSQILIDKTAVIIISNP